MSLKFKQKEEWLTMQMKEIKWKPARIDVMTWLQ